MYKFSGRVLCRGCWYQRKVCRACTIKASGIAEVTSTNNAKRIIENVKKVTKKPKLSPYLKMEFSYAEVLKNGIKHGANKDVGSFLCPHRMNHRQIMLIQQCCHYQRQLQH